MDTRFVKIVYPGLRTAMICFALISGCNEGTVP
jgi:hypothetical protein